MPRNVTDKWIKMMVEDTIEDLETIKEKHNLKSEDYKELFLNLLEIRTKGYSKNQLKMEE